MISNGKKLWHYLVVKKLSALLRGITSKNNGEFYCVNCPHSFRTKKQQKKNFNRLKVYVKIKLL